MAREQAYAEALRAYGLDWPGGPDPFAMAITAACDVWEPLLRDLVDEVGPVVMNTGLGWAAFRRAKAALDGR